MKPYKMIAFDMDGKLLNSQKEISEKTVAAMKRAMDHGFTVVLNTGRCMAELYKYFDVVDIPYVNSVSGALVFDRRQNRAVFEKGLTPELAEQVLAIAAKEDVMIHILTEKSIVQKDAIAKMDYYQMGIYRPVGVPDRDLSDRSFSCSKNKSLSSVYRSKRENKSADL